MKVALVTFPAADAAFRIFAESFVALDGESTPAALEACLRRSYPLASVNRGIVDRNAERWYAYRDGTWIASPHD